jgi:hypothetical protein
MDSDKGDNLIIKAKGGGGPVLPAGSNEAPARDEAKSMP